VLLTHKKPERAPQATTTAHLSSIPPRKKGKVSKSDGRLSPIPDDEDEDQEDQALRSREEGVQDRHLLFRVGETSDDEDDGPPAAKLQKRDEVSSRSRPLGRGEAQGLMDNGHGEADDSRSGRRTSGSSDGTLPRPEDPFRDDPDEFGDWESGSRTKK
jgi:magnesium transporter